MPFKVSSSFRLITKTIVHAISNMAGPVMDAACLTYEGYAVDPVETYLNTEEPAWVLGKYFRPDQDLKRFNEDVLSRLWVTYRKNFPPIGGVGPSSDAGWGCMLRCGQMMLAQALVCRHLGRDWRWTYGDKNPTYRLILESFLDKKDSLYSIHQIAQMGVGEGKQIGQWFGPNTVAQVIRKLVLFDDWSGMAVHVALDNTVVVEDAKKLCKSSYSSWGCYGACTTPESSPSPGRPYVPGSTPCSCGKRRSTATNDIGMSPTLGSTPRRRSTRSLSEPTFVDGDRPWRPLLLFIPLRLGLSEVNAEYYSSLKVCLTMKQSLGFIGGKPNHAHYFIGFNGNKLLYLDPHTTQPALDPDKYNTIPDQSYHCAYPCFMNFSELDPSIALGFYCHTENDFDDWCACVDELIMDKARRPMFELNKRRPRHWPPFELPKRPCDDLDCTRSDFTELSFDWGEEDQTFDTDGEYEIL